MISASSVAEIFKQSNISSVAIIDDAFDGPEMCATASVSINLFKQFSAVPELLEAFASAGKPIEDPEDLDPETLLAIKRRVASDPYAKEVWDLIKMEAVTRRTALDNFADELRKDLKLKVKKIGAASIKTESSRKRTQPKNVVDDSVDVVFLDYELQQGELEGTLSSRITDRIHSQFVGSANAPLVILMSSRALDEAAIVRFQRRTKVLSGMFYFVPKEELFDTEKRHYRLAAFAKSLATGRVLQRFVAEVDKSLMSVRDKVFSDVRSLSIGDFAFLQKLRLHDDGQPLGEYLLWLLNAHLVKELLGSDEVQAVEGEVNALAFDDLPPTQSKPSINLATLYSSAVLRPMKTLPDEPTDQSTYLQFGDLFRAGKGKKVWLCITAPCDLAFGPTRPVRSKHSVLFLPGILQPIDQPMTGYEQRQPRTELVWLDDKVYRILWDTKEVSRSDKGKILAWKTERKAERIARLNTPFALEIQRSFASDLTRIGMPTPPPFYNPVRVRLAVLNAEGAEEELTSAAHCDGYLTGDGNSQRLVLGEGFMNALPQILGTCRELLSGRVDLLSRQRLEQQVEPGMVANAKAALDKVEEARQNAKILSGLKGPFKLPAANTSVLLLDELLSFSDAAYAGTVGNHVPLRLTILPFEESAEEPETA